MTAPQNFVAHLAERFAREPLYTREDGELLVRKLKGRAEFHHEVRELELLLSRPHPLPEAIDGNVSNLLERMIERRRQSKEDRHAIDVLIETERMRQRARRA